MFRKFSKSPAPSKASASKPFPSLKTSVSLSAFGNRPNPGPRRLHTASDSNLPGNRRNAIATDGATLAPRPGGTMEESRPRRSTIATSGPSPSQRMQRPAVSSKDHLFDVVIPKIGTKIVEYMPELYEEVDPIRITGQFYTWDDPSWLDYVPLHPPPRKNVKCGRVLTKPKHGPDVCSACSSKRSFSCGSFQHVPETRFPLASSPPGP
ncbi:hypothetical protein B0H15DRAFT_819847 [Mycena belliarum]|uniref:Uncharacterized protein n=1 Tax=Mycena belliarum TaxID=1033014 RepID=A0AAD6UG20_9AGAR|nr:hypothetical protein B0H15DRAFT_819847 [Mycena belliae]